MNYIIIQNHIGEKGDEGYVGSPGIDGPVGQKGDVGFPGRRGENGDFGLQGEIGLDGRPGKRITIRTFKSRLNNNFFLNNLTFFSFLKKA